MIFRSELNIPKSSVHIDHKTKALMIGSCFSNTIGERLQKYKFNCIINPFGTIFNPVSVAKLFSIVCKESYIDKSELLFSHELFVHPDFHSSFSHTDPLVTVNKINEAIKFVSDALKELNFLFITLGTSVVHKRNDNNRIVANCHKLPASDFTKTIVSIDEGARRLFSMIEEIKIINPGINIVFTVSPVRHLKEGIIENAKSKARLIGMIEQIQAKYTEISYFPAYEWIMDDLRDYRFYESDLIHPNSLAIDYIWEKFGQHFFNTETSSLNDRIEAILRNFHHVPFNPNTHNYRIFCEKMLKDILDLKQQFPHLDLNNEIQKYSSVV